MLQVQLRKRLGAFELEAEFDAGLPGTLVLVGESGSGKSTLLKLLAGLLEPDAGSIHLDGTAAVDVERGDWQPARQRRVGYVAQDYALFPHLRVRDNVAFGLRATGVSHHDVAERVERTLGRLGIGPLAPRWPHELSGGQQQRVALARALVIEPRLLLLDEPLAALDQRTRREVRRELRVLLAELPCLTILVTHSPADAVALGERIMVLEGGRITQAGTRQDMLQHPRTPYVAEFLGTNLFAARVIDAAAGAPAQLEVDGARIAVADCSERGDVMAVVDPRDITLSREAPTGSAQNVLPGAVVELTPEPPSGDRVRVAVATSPPLVAEITHAAANRLELAPGITVFASFKATGVRVFR